ncbi:MAG: hypothetical protein MUF15_03335 [Acidobacteria bacterium]|jgi:hypothetical protein|nr:hypothetical protein [Acidobacteriota bacterium]
MKQAGRVNFTGLIMLLIIIYGGYAAVKLIAAGTMNTQIRKEVIDTLGTMRGADFSEEEGEEAIRDILFKHDVIFDENNENTVNVVLNRDKGTITFYYTYDVETNFIFFKKIRTIKVKEGLKSYD